MDNHDVMHWSRRGVLGGMALTGAAGLLGLRPESAAAEPPPETTTLRVAQFASLCVAPQYVAEELLRSEGFTEVEYKEAGPLGMYKALAAGDIDISLGFIGPFIIQVDDGSPVVMLGGAHVGCFELFANARVRAIRDLKGKTVSVPDLASGPYTFIASMVAYVGMDPRTDIHWVTYSQAEAKQLLVEGKIDAFLGFPPDPQELRAKQIGHVVVNSAVDRPWSQYFCCLVAGNRTFVRKYPVATKRALRAILKATDVCALEPDRAARSLVDRGYTQNYEYALQAMKDVPYSKWREYDPEDTVRFYALRLHESGMIKSSPQKIIAQGTDWRFFNELKQELKG
jgi:NitT/TauT family transport system substrate-binding protein